MSDEKRAAIYARVSTTEQSAEGQVERLEAWARRRDLVIVERVVETGASGRDPGREGFRRLVRLARGNRFRVLAVTKIDRWARSLMDLQRSAQELADAGCEFHAIDQGVSLAQNDPMGKAYLQFLGILAELEADLISQRTKEGLKGKNPGRPAKPCAVCGQERTHGEWASVDGKRRPVCVGCKAADPTARRQAFREKDAPEKGGVR